MANNNFTYNAPTYIDFNPQTMNDDFENVETFFETETENASSLDYYHQNATEVYPNGSQCTGTNSEKAENDKSLQKYIDTSNLIDIDFNLQTMNEGIKNVEIVFEISNDEEEPVKLRKSLSTGNLHLNYEENISENIRKLDNLRISTSHSKLKLGSRVTRDKTVCYDRLNKLAQPIQTAQQKYVSVAEMINKFYTTPDRFRTQPKNGKIPTRQFKIHPLTIPQSPCLATKNRQRDHNVLRRSEMEKIEMEEYNKFKIKGQPVSRRVLQGPIKAITIPKRTVCENHQKKSVMPNENPFKPTQTYPIPFSFDARDQRLAKRRQEMINKVLEEENKAHNFRANPPPKYLFKKSSSLNSLKSTKSEDETKDVPISFKARPPVVLYQKPFVPKKPERSLIEITELCLNTNRRAKEREEFDKKIQERMVEINKVKLLREDEKMRVQQKEIEQLRKQTVHVAQPIRHYKGVKIEPSGKVTVPITPKFKTSRPAHEKENSM